MLQISGTPLLSRWVSSYWKRLFPTRCLPVALGQMLYMIGSAWIPAPLTTLIGTMEAPVATLWAWMGVGEVPETATIVGGAIVVASVFGRVLPEQRCGRTQTT